MSTEQQHKEATQQLEQLRLCASVINSLAGQRNVLGLDAMKEIDKSAITISTKVNHIANGLKLYRPYVGQPYLVDKITGQHTPLCDVDWEKVSAERICTNFGKRKTTFPPSGVVNNNVDYNANSATPPPSDKKVSEDETSKSDTLSQTPCEGFTCIPGIPLKHMRTTDLISLMESIIDILMERGTDGHINLLNFVRNHKPKQ